MLYLFLLIGVLLVIWGVINIIRHLFKSIINSNKYSKKTQPIADRKSIKVKSKGKELVKEIQRHREDLLKIINHHLSTFEKLKADYVKWHETGLDAFRKSPVALNKEKIKVKEDMDDFLKFLDTNITDLTNCKSKSISEIEQTLFRAEKSLEEFKQRINAILSEFEDLSSKWKFLTYDDKVNLGTLKKI